MSETNKTLWVDLRRKGFEILLANFEESPGEQAIVVRGNDPFTDEEASKISRAGFTKISGPRNVWARRGKVFKMRELRDVFRGMITREMDYSDTRILVRGASPFVAALPKEDRLPEKFIEGNVKLHADAVNAYQVKYKPGSKLGKPIAMVPVNMAEATAIALSRIEAEYGPIDDFVAERLDMTPHEMGSVLSPEQIDAVAMGIAAMLRGREFILADQTGLGKGRVLAAMARAAAVAGKPVIFITVKANLFSDFWRDITDIASDKMFGKPFLLNNNAKIQDVTSVNGDVLFESEKPDVIRKQVKTGKLPEGTKIMMSTYSQYNRLGTPKADFLGSVAEGAFVISDEAHEASKRDSNTTKTVDPAIESAWGAIRSSATFVRQANALLSYKKVLPPSLRNEETLLMLEAGGNALAEAMSQYLAEDGVLIRREHDLSGLSIEVKTDDLRRERNRAYADALAPILSRMAKLARLVNDEIEVKNEENEKNGIKPGREKWYTANFGSRLSPLVRQFITALEVDYCVDQCLEALAMGEKPVIVIESTMESLMRELASDGDDTGFSEDDDMTEEELAKAKESRPPDFRAALHLMLDRAMQMTVKRAKEDPEKFPVEDPFCIEEADLIRRLIDEFPDLSLSPIDDIRDRIEEVGRKLFEEGKLERPYRADEISARKLRVQDGQYEIRQIAERNDTIVAFNSGPIDALIITKAASTGLSLHASERVADQRRRRMIELQIPANVVERVQFWGRVNRRGQVSVPSFETLCTGLPFQMRTMAMENRKVAALSANVSANAENANAMDVPDLIDKVGNEVAHRILEDQPRLADHMCIAMKVDPEEAEAELYFINKLLQRLILLSSDEQDKIFARLLHDYEDAIGSLKAKGGTPRGVREMEGVWTEVSRKTYEAGDAADGPVFGRSVDIVTMEGRFERDPITGERVQGLVRDARGRLAQSSGAVAGPFFEAEIKAIKNNRMKVLNASLAGRYTSVKFALAAKEPNAVKNAEDRMKNLVGILQVIQPGLSMSVPLEDNEQKTAVITDVRAPIADEAHLPGSWRVKYAVPGDAHVKEISVATLLKDKSYSLHQARLGFVPEPSLGPFDRAPRGVVTETRQFLDGNMVKAVTIAGEVKAGSMVVYYDSENVRKRSVLLSKNGEKLLFNRSNKIAKPEESLSVINSGRLLFSDHYNRANGMIIEKDGRFLLVTIPRNKSGKTFETDEIKGVCGVFRDQGTVKRARIPEEKLLALADAIMTSGISLHFDPPQGASSFKSSPPKKDFSGSRFGFGAKR